MKTALKQKVIVNEEKKIFDINQVQKEMEKKDYKINVKTNDNGTYDVVSSKGSYNIKQPVGG